MKPVSTAAEVRELDRRVIEGLGLPGIALMELASRHVAVAVARHHDADARRGVVVACGGGNNGGDGWAVARWLRGWGYPVSVWAVRAPSTEDARTMAAVARAAGVPEVDGPDGAGLLVDAVLGTGLEQPVRAGLDEALAALGAVGRPIVAVDLPSGLHADTGQALGHVPTAVRTVTFARAKRGLYAGQGPACAGRVEVVDIGLDAATSPEALRSVGLVEADDVPWPRRARDAHKGHSGHLAVVAGSEAMAGAAVLTCRGALAAGAGRITLVTARDALPRLGALPPEVMVRLGGDRVLDELPDLGFADAVVAGPGLGGGEPLRPVLHDALAAAWQEATRPMLYDADALVCTAPTACRERVLTPHPGEAGRLLGCTAREVEADRYAAVHALARRGVALLKGPFTLVADGALTTINPTGSPALATGGSGDVLAGIVGALLARGLPSERAARTGAWFHGLAGERLREGDGAGALAPALVEAVRPR